MRSALRWASGSPVVVCAPASWLATAKISTDIKSLARACSICEASLDAAFERCESHIGCLAGAAARLTIGTGPAGANTRYPTTVINQPRPVLPSRFEPSEAVAVPGKKKVALASPVARGRQFLKRLAQLQRWRAHESPLRLAAA